MASRTGTIERMAKEKNKGGRPAGVPTQKNKMLREMIEEFTVREKITTGNNYHGKNYHGMK